MSVYIWYCTTCNLDTEVERVMADYELPPDAGCDQCGGTALTRVVRPKRGVKGFVLEGQGWHDQEYSATKSRK